MLRMTSKTVLVVDDEIEIAKALRRLLRKDFNVEVAHSGDEALQCIAQCQVDLVLSDFRMPGMNGAQLLEAVKRSHPDIVRVMLSGYADISALAASVNDGEVVRFLRKPWDDAELLQVLHKLLSAQTLVASLARPFRSGRIGVETQLAQTDTSALVTVRMAGTTFDPGLAIELIKKFLGALDQTEAAVVGGLIQQHAGRLSFTAEVGGEQRLVLEVPLDAPKIPVQSAAGMSR